MKKPILVLLCFLCSISNGHSQQTSQLRIDDFMKGYDWIGHSPNRIRWSENGEKIYFNWNPENLTSDSLYEVSISNLTPRKVSLTAQRSLPSFAGSLSPDGSFKTYEKNGDIYVLNIKEASIRQLTNTITSETNPKFLSGSSQVVYEMANNLFLWESSDGSLSQLTNFKKGKAPKKTDEKKENEEWLENDQLSEFEILTNRKNERNASDSIRNSRKPSRPSAYYYGSQNISQLQISPKGDFVTFRLTKKAKSNRNTKVPNYVTESGYVEEYNARTKVGDDLDIYSMGIYDVNRDTTYLLKTEDIPGIEEHPEFLTDYIKNHPQYPKQRDVIALGPIWSESGNNALVIIRSMDNKDRWIMTLDAKKGSLKLLDRQTDNAWVGGPGIGSWNFLTGDVGFFKDEESIWFVSEETGYAHLYHLDLKSGKKKALTKGDFEIYDPSLSKDGNYFYFSSNQVNSGERHFYKMKSDGKGLLKLTTMEGRNDVVLSPDEKSMAILNSRSNHPPELYYRLVAGKALPKQITDSQTNAFKAYPWRTPAFITFKAADGADVPARLYAPDEKVKNNAAIIFVHGAGYLQNAHKWWSSYYREYMFHNFLADQGYTVLDIDYRGSAGYGRDWRTAIYQHMGGKDLDDQIDGAKYLINAQEIDPDKIGIYGGSYGGFITLMALFKHPGTFNAGAALRSVTDWAHYNHGYTSNILNTPITDSLAYAKSSPIYFADGLADHLLICHGMVDTNVQFQDVVRLSQRLIELRKENWEMAIYPMEGHGFVEESSWADEYKRIYKLFETHLK